MPELPENETQRRLIERECLNRTIEAVVLGDDVSYITLPGDNERAPLVGRQFTETRRHGKNIFAGSKTGPWMAVHLGMTGRLIAFDAPAEAPDKTKLLIRFEGDRRLAFRCPRKLGKLRIIDDVDGFIARQRLGPDALAIGRKQFVEAVGPSASPIKAALMDQHKLAGVGNLWSDEALYQTGIDPRRPACELDRDTLEEIRKVMRAALEAAVAAGANYSDLPEDWLIRNRRKGAECPRCDGTIVSAKVGGRTAYFCSKHQK